MSTATISFIPLTTPKTLSLSDDVVIGKDVLELLAGAMYADPLTIYREYTQNAADSIDEARRANSNFGDGPNVQISLDHAERSITIRDQGESIRSSNFLKRLSAIGASNKRGKNLRGFRGVGRLSGLGYCQELIFRGRAEGEQNVTEVRWDARRLREVLRDQNYSSGLADVVKEIVSSTSFSGQGFPRRFFEVQLRKVVRLRNDILMNEDAIRTFLSQVGPVPFAPGFKFGNKIHDFLRQHGLPAPVTIELDDGKGPIYHRAVHLLPASKSDYEEVRGVDFREWRDAEGQVIAAGWLLEHSYCGAISKKLGYGGIRLRSGNIQVGDDDILAPLFPESRFSSWAIGDIHVLSPKIIPNGRRDEFEPSSHYSYLQEELSPLAKEITHRIRDSSDQRNKLKRLRTELDSATQWLHATTKNGGRLQPVLRESLHRIVFTRIGEAKKIASRIAEHSDERAIAEKRISQLEKQAAAALMMSKRKSPQKGGGATQRALDVLGLLLKHSSPTVESISICTQVAKKINSR